MAAKKTVPKPGKTAHKKAAPAKPVSKKTAAPARKPAAAPAAKAKPAARPAAPAKSHAAPAKKPIPPAKETETKPHVSSPPARSESKTSLKSPPVHADAAEDGENGDNNSLLAGPRNVQPYVVKRGEQYMSKEQLDHFRQILLNWKQDLMLEVDRTVSHMKDEAANFPDPNDRATQEEEFSLELRTRDRERKLIRKIDEALKRVEDGSYGYCLETGEQIGIKRLEARPVATLSIEAQERRERREKQYGDRDDRYR
jgi:DnaK suppressor protein